MIGEPSSLTNEMTAEVSAIIPEKKPRYLMGCGYPEDIIEAVAQGVDLFDCVLPTRNGRTGMAFTSGGKVVIKAGAMRPIRTRSIRTVHVTPVRISRGLT